MTTPFWTILLAAGQGARLSRVTGDIRKQFLPYHGAPLYWHSVRTLAALPTMRGIVVVLPEEQYTDHRAVFDTLRDKEPFGIALNSVAGGLRRQDSVRLGLAAVPKECATVLVHDSARPFFSAALVHDLITALTEEVDAVVPGLAVTDTIKERKGDLVVQTLRRATLAAVQTPQLFRTATLRQAHALALREHWEVTDDASMIELAGKAVRVVPGEAENRKITNPEDLHLLHSSPAPDLPCTGLGYDVHAYGGNRPLVLGGMPIAGAPLVQAHSDGDVLLHALCDAILGCVGLGDIGDHFPDSNAAYDNISSAVLLSEVLDKARKAGLLLTHVDLTIVAQVPRLSPHKTAIRQNVARLLELADTQVNLKATTEEHLGFTGRKEGIKAVAVVTGTRTRT